MKRTLKIIIERKEMIILTSPLKKPKAVLLRGLLKIIIDTQRYD
ncbi:MAG: hypothetical protein U9Q83_11400 [Bacteroidota bacterium]|nr:hypothetical protein [Bacteroidota bacterium]